MGLGNPRIGIIGGTGKMGTWLTDLLEKRGFTVLCSGRSTDLTPSEMVRQSDVVVVSVPITDTERVIKEVGPLIKDEGLLMDLASIKKGPVEAMLKYSKAQVVGLHPLFGPVLRSDKDRRVAVCPGRGESGLNWVMGIFQDEGFNVTLLDPEEHDRVMGLIQAVNHFSTLALGLCISRTGFELRDLFNLSTQTFQERLERIGAIAGQPPELFEALLMENPAAGKYLEEYLESVEQLIRITRAGDRKAFGEMFESIKEVFTSGLL